MLVQAGLREAQYIEQILNDTVVHSFSGESSSSFLSNEDQCQCTTVCMARITCGKYSTLSVYESQHDGAAPTCSS